MSKAIVTKAAGAVAAIGLAASLFLGVAPASQAATTLTSPCLAYGNTASNGTLVLNDLCYSVRSMVAFKSGGSTIQAWSPQSYAGLWIYVDSTATGHGGTLWTSANSSAPVSF